MEERKTAAEETTTAKLRGDAKVQRNPDMAKDSKVNPETANRISMLNDELARCENQLEEQATIGNTQTDGIFIVKSANQAMQDAKDIPDPKQLLFSLWNDVECAICLLIQEIVSLAMPFRWAPTTTFLSNRGKGTTFFNV